MKNSVTLDLILDYEKNLLSKQNISLAHDYFSFQCRLWTFFLNDPLFYNKIIFDDNNNKSREVKNRFKSSEFDQAAIYRGKSEMNIPANMNIPFYEQISKNKTGKKINIRGAKKSVGYINSAGKISFDLVGHEKIPVEYIVNFIYNFLGEYESLKKANICIHFGEEYNSKIGFIFSLYKLLNYLKILKEESKNIEINIQLSHLVGFFDNSKDNYQFLEYGLLLELSLSDQNKHMKIEEVKNFYKNPTSNIKVFEPKKLVNIIFSKEGKLENAYFQAYEFFVDARQYGSSLDELYDLYKEEVMYMLRRDKIIVDINLSSNLLISKLCSIENHDFIANTNKYRNLKIGIGSDIPTITGKSIHYENEILVNLIPDYSEDLLKNNENYFNEIRNRLIT